ncbi:MAG TPA: hypothetical protein VMD92_18790 [Acidobacteriaceae bacterium]|jgi:hypothetical protein|nr:hypothetical protein [Acidobacteriaceae bacterium]
MRMLGSRISFRRRTPHLCACLALALFSAASLCAQKTGLAFWEPPASADALLAHPPKHDPDRYAALRQAFIGFHCTADLMQEQPVGTHGDKNLICTLPGQTPVSILVVARYDGHAGPGFQSTWVDAAVLPLLDHALQAQPRRHTIIFAALIGDNGETSFFTALRNSGKPLPSAMIILDGLGWGSPLWYTVPSVKATPTHPAELGVNGFLGGIASAICRFMKVPEPAPLSPAHYLTNAGFSAAEYYRLQRYESSLFRSAGATPELLIFSDQPEQATQQAVVDIGLPDIRKDFDYAAYVVCLADLKLDPPPVPAVTPTAATDSAPH